MANGEGALVAQQRAGVEIPYRNLELGLEETKNALGAFYMGTQINKQQRAMQAAMDKLNLENEKLAFQDKWHEENYARLSQAQDLAYQIKQENSNRQWMALNQKWENYKKVRDDDASIAEYIQASGKHPGEPGYDAVLLEGKHLYPFSSMKIDDAIKDHNRARDDHERSLLARQNAILHKFGEDYAGIPNWSNARLFMEPDTQSLRTYQTDQGVPGVPDDPRFATDPNTGKKLTFKLDPDTGQRIETDQLAVPVQTPNAAGGISWSKFLVPKKEMIRIQKELQSLNEESKSIAPVSAAVSSPGVIDIHNQADFDRLQHGDRYRWTDPATGKTYPGVKP